MPTDKEFNTIENQIRLLKNRNLKFNNLYNTKKHLLDKNYFNLINGFETLLIDNPKNPPKKYTNKSFDDFVRLYDFDSHFSSLIFKSISEFETKLKTSIAYHFCKNHCSTLEENNGYIDISNYKIPTRTDGPREYVSFFYNKGKENKSHKLFKENYYYLGNFRGSFEGIVTYNSNKTKLYGLFTGRFGSTSIRKVKGSCTFYNSKQQALLATLKTHTSQNGNSVFLGININGNERIYGLNYIDECKTKFPYINEYNNPPFWVVIKTLMLNDIIILMYGLKKRTFDAVLKDFDLKPRDRERFINSLAIIKELRNSSAHFELVNRFRTSNSLKIDNRLISDLHLTPMKPQYIIKLYDVLKIMGMYVDLSEIKLFILEFWYQEIKNYRSDIAVSLFKRMGNSNIDDWIKNI